MKHRGVAMCSTAGDDVTTRVGRGGRADADAVCIAVLIGLLYAGYFILRYGGLWTENDTALFSQITAETVQRGTVLFSTQYSHGFGYPGWLGALSLLTGLSPAVVNTAIMPFIGSLLLVVPCFLLYRGLLDSHRGAFLAILVLLAVGELVFTVLRGNHEKLNIALTLASLFVLFKGFSTMGSGRWGELAAWVVLFYGFTFTNANVNDYFASTFALAATLTLITAHVVRLRQGGTGLDDTNRRLILVVAVSWLVTWWVMLYVFPLAGQDFALLKTTGQKVTHLFLTFHGSSNPYSEPAQQWSGALAYWALSAFRWVLLGGSFLVWLRELWLVVVKRRAVSLHHLFLLAMYGGYGFLVAAAIPADFTGLNAGTNLEVRDFTYFALLAAPLFAKELMSRMDVGHKRAASVDGTGRGRALRTAAWRWAGGSLLVAFIAVGVLKTTVDPIVSNLWMFYSSAERQALTAFWHHARLSVLWTGPDNRLVNVITTWQHQDPNGDQVSGFAIDRRPQIRDLLMSPQLVANATAQHFPLPDVHAQNRVYDDGPAQIYRYAPQSPFQD